MGQASPYLVAPGRFRVSAGSFFVLGCLLVLSGGTHAARIVSASHRVDVAALGRLLGAAVGGQWGGRWRRTSGLSPTRGLPFCPSLALLLLLGVVLGHCDVRWRRAVRGAGEEGGRWVWDETMVVVGVKRASKQI